MLTRLASHYLNIWNRYFLGRLAGYGLEDQNPTIAIVAHYDADGAAPSLSRGADSNGSGVVALLEIARIFSKLYTSKLTHAKVNFIFLLSSGKNNCLRVCVHIEL